MGYLMKSALSTNSKICQAQAYNLQWSEKKLFICLLNFVEIEAFLPINNYE